MVNQTINIGSTANDGTGDPLRDAFDKINDNFSLDTYVKSIRSITSNTYTTVAGDYYLGVNTAAPCTITLHTPDDNGIMLLIKDETYNADSNNITVVGSIEQTSNVVMAISGSSLTLVYNNGWRII